MIKKSGVRFPTLPFFSTEELLHCLYGLCVYVSIVFGPFSVSVILEGGPDFFLPKVRVGSLVVSVFLYARGGQLRRQFGVCVVWRFLIFVFLLVVFVVGCLCPFSYGCCLFSTLLALEISLVVFALRRSCGYCA